MPNKSPKVLVGTGYASLIIAFLVFGVLPIVQGHTAAQAQITQAQTEIRSRLEKKQQLESIQKLVASLKLDTSGYDRLVPNTPEFSPFLLSFGHEWVDVGLRERDLSVRSLPPMTLGRSEKRPIEIRGRGTYAQFHKFLERLESLDRLSSIGRLSIDADSSLNGIVDIQLTLFIYNTKPS